MFLFFFHLSFSHPHSCFFSHFIVLMFPLIPPLPLPCLFFLFASLLVHFFLLHFLIDPAGSWTSRKELCGHSSAKGKLECNLQDATDLLHCDCAHIVVIVFISCYSRSKFVFVCVRACLLACISILQVCATCFDLSVSLLRVLEMTVTLVPEIFLDWSRPSAELLLRRLAQVGLTGSPAHCCQLSYHLSVWQWLVFNAGSTSF